MSVTFSAESTTNGIELRIGELNSFLSEKLLQKNTPVLRNLIEQNGLELGPIVISGNTSTTYMVYEKTTDGKINWRRWVPYPDGVSDEAKALLDKIAEFPEIAEMVAKAGGDGYSKFSAFYMSAYKRGLITEGEARMLQNQLHAVANGKPQIK